MIKFFSVILFSVIIQGCSSNFKKVEQTESTDIQSSVADVKKACKELSNHNSEEFLECFKFNIQKIE